MKCKYIVKNNRQRNRKNNMINAIHISFYRH